MVENISYSSGAITYKQGTNAQLAIRLKVDNTTPIALSGYTAVLEVQKDYTAKTNDCQITATHEYQPEGDVLIFAFVPSSLSAVRLSTDSSERVYQVKITDVDGKVSIPLQGVFTLIKDIS